MSFQGRSVVVTGANSGIGFHAARVLAERGADVVLAVRDITRGEAAAGRMRGAVQGPASPKGDLHARNRNGRLQIEISHARLQ